MNRFKILGLFVVGAMAITITLGAVVYRSASASGSTGQAAHTVVNTKAFNSTMMGKGSMDGLQCGYSDDDLATALGITVDELTAARQKAFSTALAQAVEQGLITQAQADELTSNGTAFPFGNRWEGWLAQNGFDFNALLADALGITVDKLQAAYAQAYNTRIDQAVTDGKLTQEQADLMKGQYALQNDETFQASMQSAYEAAIQQAVKDGVITQAQADLILKNSAKPGLGDFRGFDQPRGFGNGNFPGGPGGGRHGNWKDTNNTNQSEAPTTAP
jgi:polyhydroxyalkanoate synthesis regulator phasin